MSAPLRVGVVGCGNVAMRYHLPAYLSVPDRFTVVGLADPLPAQLEAGRVAAGLAADQVHADALALVARDDVEVVDVCSPQHLHRDVVVAALRAGKHVLCEKPVASRPADAAAMVEAAAASGTVLAVVNNFLFFPEIAELRRLTGSGALGDVRTVRVDLLGVVDSPGAEGYRPRWRHDPAESGGGVLMDMLHGVYVAERLLGAPVEAVSAWVDSAGEGEPVEGLALCRLEADGRAALVNIGWGVGPGGIAVHGSRGRAVARYADDGTVPWAPLDTLTVTTAGGTRAVDLPAGEDLLVKVAASQRAVVLDLADAIAERRAPLADGATALRTLEVTVAAYASAALGRHVPLPLPVHGPLHRLGVAGLLELDVPETALVRRRGLFGLSPDG